VSRHCGEPGGTAISVVIRNRPAVATSLRPAQ
jgi:hypothetical protein